MKPVVGITFYNQQAKRLILWIELACIELTLEPATEYRIESDETEYRIEFRQDDFVILYLQYRFGPKIFKRPYSNDFNNQRAWEMIEDYSDI